MIKVTLVECMNCKNTKFIPTIDWYNGVQIKCECDKPQFKNVGSGVLI